MSCPLTQPGRPRQGNGIVLTDRVTPPRPQHKEMRPLTPDEADTFLATTREDRLHALYAVLVTTGLRIGEATGLQWYDVDLEARFLIVRRAIKRGNRQGTDCGCSEDAV